MKINRNELIKKLKECRIVDNDQTIRVKQLDYSNNPLSPVDTAYRVFYTSLGQRKKSTYFNESLGFQG